MLLILLITVALPTPVAATPVTDIPITSNCELPDGDVDGDECFTQDVARNNGGDSPDCGTCGAYAADPINIATGSKFEVETDYSNSDLNPLILNRYYNSSDNQLSTLGIGWRISYSRVIALTANSNQVVAIRDDGKKLTFTLTGGIWIADGTINSKLTKLSSGWRYTTGLDEIETYNADGHLISVANRFGLVQTLTYDSQGNLHSVTNAFGRTLTFSYTGTQVTSVTDPNAGVYTYAYDAHNNLSTVTYPDTTRRQFVYENTTYPHALTGVLDEKGVRYSTDVYEPNLGLDISNELAGGANKTSIDYSHITLVNNSYVAVKNALGGTDFHYFISINGVAVENAVERSCPVCETARLSREFDLNGNIKKQTDFNGNITIFSYDATRNLETSRTEAFGTPQARTITTQWHATFRLPITITEPNHVIKLTYDAQANLIQRAITSGTLSRVWKYSYNAKGQVLQADGPRTDLNDITKYAYYANGNLSTVTDALANITRITSYNANGQPLILIDPNGLTTTLAYDLRGRLLSRNVGGEITLYAYDAAGQAIKITQPTGAFLTFTYDDAHRLIGVNDDMGNKVTYTLDAMGNQLKTESYDPANTLATTRSQEFDGLSRLLFAVGATNQATLFEYDKNDNVTQITDPLLHSTAKSYDPLNRLMSSVDANGGDTSYRYNGNDKLTAITDAEGVATQYTLSGLGDVTKLTSHDTGITNTTYDAAGNTHSATDALGNITNYSYDALNRVKVISYSNGRTVSFTYDSGLYGIGRLTRVTDSTGSTSWSYDIHGRIINKNQLIGTVSLVTKSVYDTAGRLSSVVYPSGNTLVMSYVRSHLQSIKNGTTTLLSAIKYTAFDAVKGWTWGNGTLYQRTFDADGRLTSYPLGANILNLTYDDAGRITNYNSLNTGLNQQFDYDALGRVTNVMAAQNQNIDYDSVGNRISQTKGATAYLYSYQPGSNRLNNISNKTDGHYTYDAAGHQITDGVNNFTYDARGRLTALNKTGTNASYSINGLGQRVSKVVNATGTLFSYDESGHLIGEYNSTGVLIQETVYLGDMPVAVLTPGGGRYYVFSDQLNAPHRIATTTGKVVWQWLGDPFGTALANNDPDADGVKFTYNLRFPGQYFDGESGLHYNGFRDYDPKTGRYIESDPIGLAGGANTFGYVGGNPVGSVDGEGLVGYTLNFFDKILDKVLYDSIERMRPYVKDGEMLIGGHAGPTGQIAINPGKDGGPWVKIDNKAIMSTMNYVDPNKTLKLVRLNACNSAKDSTHSLSLAKNLQALDNHRSYLGANGYYYPDGMVADMYRKKDNTPVNFENISQSDENNSYRIPVERPYKLFLGKDALIGGPGG